MNAKFSKIGLSVFIQTTLRVLPNESSSLAFDESLDLIYKIFLLEDDENGYFLSYSVSPRYSDSITCKKGEGISSHGCRCKR